jgi:hypothetical protein
MYALRMNHLFTFSWLFQVPQLISLKGGGEENVGKISLVSSSIFGIFVGNSDKTEINDLVKEENRLYNNIIIIDIKQKYENLAKKNLYIFWNGCIYEL